MSKLGKFTILFGSQTGNSEDVSERMGRLVRRMNCKSCVASLKDYPISQLINETFVVFVCSTTGNGEVPDNMKSFWRFLLRKDLPSNSLCQLKFSVFGMGDSSYDKFNVVAKKLNKRLLQLGAIELIPLTLADDQHELGYDAALDPWILNLKSKLIEIFNLDEPVSTEDILLPPKYKVFFDESSDLVPDTEVNGKACSFATLKYNKRLTQNDHFQAVHLLKFGIESDVKYEPGDVAVVDPENPIDEVEDFLSLLNVPSDRKFHLIPTDSDTPLPKKPSYPTTVRDCAKTYFDILSVPRRSFFEFFHHFSTDELEKEKLLEFTTAAGQEELYSYCNRPKRNILEVLKDFPHTTPYVPFEYFFDMIPCIRPRSFSIASSLCTYPNEFHLLIAIVNYKTRLQKPRKGLCSNWLKNLHVGASIPFSIKNGSIVLPKQDNPVIMIGPGTGCAPFRSFVQRRVTNNNCDNYLFFGCRYKSKDFFFEDEWIDLVKKKSLTIFTAFSRDQEEKNYVQHKIKENSTLLWNLIHNKEAFIYVAGNAKQMPQGVKDAFLNVLKEAGGLDQESGMKYLQNLENKKRYQSETWA